MRNQLENMFDGIWRDFSYFHPQYEIKSLCSIPSTTHSYQFKLENDGAIQVYTQDLPGVKKEDLILEVLETNKLRVSYERNAIKAAYDVVPSKGYDVETADAKLELGVLEVRFTKREVSSKKKIVVK